MAGGGRGSARQHAERKEDDNEVSKRRHRTKRNATKTMTSSSRRGKIRGHHRGGYLLKVAFAAAIISAYLVALKIVIITVMLQTNDEASQQQQHNGLLEGVKRTTRSIDNIILNDDNQDSVSANNNFTRFMSYGPLRSASTLQFNMVCVCFFLHMKVHKPTLANSTICYFKGNNNYNYPSLDLPQGTYSTALTSLS